MTKDEISSLQDKEFENRMKKNRRYKTHKKGNKKLQ
jgi:hypothetical protein